MVNISKYTRVQIFIHTFIGIQICILLCLTLVSTLLQYMECQQLLYDTQFAHKSMYIHIYKDICRCVCKKFHQLYAFTQMHAHSPRRYSSLLLFLFLPQWTLKTTPAWKLLRGGWKRIVTSNSPVALVCTLTHTYISWYININIRVYASVIYTLIQMYV